MYYEVKALDHRQQVVRLALQALDDREASRHAAAQGYAVLSVRSLRRWSGFHLGRRRFPLTFFTQELLTLLQAGLGLVEAIEALAEKELGESKAVLQQVISVLYEGHTFSQALERQPAVFPELYVALVRASERTGHMNEALSRYLAYRAQVDQVRKKIITASLYPALLILVGGLVTLFLLVYVVPRFSLIYADVGNSLPFLSRLLMSWGQLLAAHGAALLIASLVLVLLGAYVASRARWRLWLAAWVWRMPIVGGHLRSYQLARFYSSLSTLLQGGIPLARAIEMAGGLLSPGLRPQLKKVAKSIGEGLALSVAIESHQLATPIASRLIAVGERSGQLGDMLEHAARFHDEELARWVESFIKLFEPLLMVVIGLMIGGIVVLMYMPIFELAGSLQ